MFRLPAAISPVPPLMIFLPTMLPLGIQIATPIVGRAAAIAMVADRFVQSGLSLFNIMLAPLPSIRMEKWCCHKQQKRCRNQCCEGCSYKLLFQRESPSTCRWPTLHLANLTKTRPHGAMQSFNSTHALNSADRETTTPTYTFTESRRSAGTYFTAAVRSSLSQAKGLPWMARFSVRNRTNENT